MSDKPGVSDKSEGSRNVPGATQREAREAENLQKLRRAYLEGAMLPFYNLGYRFTNPGPNGFADTVRTLALFCKGMATVLKEAGYKPLVAPPSFVRLFVVDQPFRLVMTLCPAPSPRINDAFNFTSAALDNMEAMGVAVTDSIALFVFVVALNFECSTSMQLGSHYGQTFSQLRNRVARCIFSTQAPRLCALNWSPDWPMYCTRCSLVFESSSVARQHVQSCAMADPFGVVHDPVHLPSTFEHLVPKATGTCSFCRLGAADTSHYKGQNHLTTIERSSSIAAVMGTELMMAVHFGILVPGSITGAVDLAYGAIEQELSLSSGSLPLTAAWFVNRRRYLKSVHKVGSESGSDTTCDSHDTGRKSSAKTSRPQTEESEGSDVEELVRVSEPKRSASAAFRPAMPTPEPEVVVIKKPIQEYTTPHHSCNRALISAEIPAVPDFITSCQTRLVTQVTAKEDFIFGESSNGGPPVLYVTVMPSPNEDRGSRSNLFVTTKAPHADHYLPIRISLCVNLESYNSGRMMQMTDFLHDYELAPNTQLTFQAGCLAGNRCRPSLPVLFAEKVSMLTVDWGHPGADRYVGTVKSVGVVLQKSSKNILWAYESNAFVVTKTMQPFVVPHLCADGEFYVAEINPWWLGRECKLSMCQEGKTWINTNFHVEISTKNSINHDSLNVIICNRAMDALQPHDWAIATDVFIVGAAPEQVLAPVGDMHGWFEPVFVDLAEGLPSGIFLEVDRLDSEVALISKKYYEKSRTKTNFGNKDLGGKGAPSTGAPSAAHIDKQLAALEYDIDTFVQACGDQPSEVLPRTSILKRVFLLACNKIAIEIRSHFYSGVEVLTGVQCDTEEVAHTLVFKCGSNESPKLHFLTKEPKVARAIAYMKERAGYCYCSVTGKIVKKGSTLIESKPQQEVFAAFNEYFETLLARCESMRPATATATRLASARAAYS